jgi:hypothetical protein
MNIFFRVLIIFVLFSISLNVSAQLKFLIEDFEGFPTAQTNLNADGIFSYGSINLEIEKKTCTGYDYSGLRALKVNWDGKNNFGGFGKGLSSFVQLDASTDFFNFYTFVPSSNGRPANFRITLDDDDNMNGHKEEFQDDSWKFNLTVQPNNEWNLISIPLKDFYDSNKGGDGIFNISYKEGKLLTLAVNFTDSSQIKHFETWSFDFFCFSKGKLPVSENIFQPVVASSNNFCLLGAWSDAGYQADINRIPESFIKNLNVSDNKLRIVHFFRPLNNDGSKKEDNFPDIESINRLFSRGYQPMITLEMQYLKVGKKVRQPSLQEISSGKYDRFLTTWAKTIKKVNGNVWVRILHEFNGDWYPWCISRNGNDPKLFVNAYRHIHDILKQEAGNIKFIWCPNSVSVPQESWNFVMDAYPGDEYVDYTGIDVYNGAEEIYKWRSFRKETSENYFLFTEQAPLKPLIICEVASRERTSSEKGDVQNKAEWIKQMSDALKTDLSKIQLISWFNAYDKFKVSSSKEASEAFRKYIWEDDYFKSGK